MQSKIRHYIKMYNYIFLLTLFLATTEASLWDTIIQGIVNITNYLPESIETQDAHLNINQLAEKYGYRLENHTVTTEDGYILKIHRIPFGRSRKNNGKVVFLMHGISDCSDSWLLQGPGKALGYILADEGYDVWMGNARGTRHSNKHISYNSSSNEYWKFSWDEIGQYDLSAMIDYTLNYTDQKTLYYVGYSQGTTTYFVLTSMKPEYNDKISLMFALAPEVFMGNIISPFIRLLSPANNFLKQLLSYFNIYSSSEELLNSIGPAVCSLFYFRCDNILYTFMGPNNVNERLWPVILGHMPTGTSTFQFIHYGQLVNSNRFSRFDHGLKINKLLYGVVDPPDYNLTNVRSPVILFYGGSDWLSNPRDVQKLIEILPNVQMSYFIKHFGHTDYAYADDAKTFVYDYILKHLEQDS